MTWRLPKLRVLFTAIVFVGLYAPILLVVVFSVNKDPQLLHWKGFTLDWYRELFGNTRMLIIVLNTIIIALLSAAISTIIGVCGAIGIWLIKSKISRQTLLSLNNILIVSPDVVIGASFLILFTIIGIKLGFPLFNTDFHITAQHAIIRLIIKKNSK